MGADERKDEVEEDGFPVTTAAEGENNEEEGGSKEYRDQSRLILPAARPDLRAGRRGRPAPGPSVLLALRHRERHGNRARGGRGHRGTLAALPSVARVDARGRG